MGNEGLHALENNDKISASTALGRISRARPPSRLFYNSIALLVVPYMIGLAAILTYTFVLLPPFISVEQVDPSAEHGYQVLGYVLGAGLGISLIWFSVLLGLRRMIVVNLFRGLIAPLEELCSIRDGLVQYLRDIDQRTTGVVHCVTTTKIVNYFILQQIRDALVVILDDMEGLFSERSIQSYFLAHKIISGDLFFQDGVIAGTGGTHTIPLARTKDTLDHLITDLERGMRRMEGELSESRKGYSVGTSFGAGDKCEDLR